MKISRNQFLAGGAAALGAFFLFGGAASAAEKKIAKIARSIHGKPVVDFTRKKILWKKGRNGNPIYRVEVEEPLEQLATSASKKLGRRVTPGVLLLASLMESEEGNHPDLARVAVAYAALTKAKKDSPGLDITSALRKLLLPAKYNGKLGSQHGRYATTSQPPTERDIELAESIALGKVANPVPGAIKWDSPKAQNELYDKGLYDHDSDYVADNRQNKEGLSVAYLPGIDPNELRLWKTA